MKLDFIKRQYFDSRLGMIVLSPVMVITNTVLLVYNFTALQNIMPLRYFAPLFIIGFVIAVVLIGRIFRKHQQSTDNALAFDQDKKRRWVELVTLKALHDIKPNDEVLGCIRELERIVK